jgi:hypothetical protein
MQQSLNNSQFKAQKKRPGDQSQKGSQSSTDMNLIYQDFKLDSKNILDQSDSKFPRIKRIQSGEDDSFEEPEVTNSRKRVKLEAKGKCITNELKTTVKKTKNKKTLTETKKSLLVPQITTSISTNHSTDIENKSIGKLDISNESKRIIENILKKKKEEESKSKSMLGSLKEGINYINYNNIFKTPDKFQKINNEFSVSNSLTKEKESESKVIEDEKKEAKLSQQVLDEINRMRTERKNRFLRESTPQEKRNNSSSFSMRFKYEDLLKEERELILPPSYKSLYNSFTHLDQTLNFYKFNVNTQRPPTFDEVKYSIESTYKRYDYLIN